MDHQNWTQFTVLPNQFSSFDRTSIIISCFSYSLQCLVFRVYTKSHHNTHVNQHQVDPITVSLLMFGILNNHTKSDQITSFFSPTSTQRLVHCLPSLIPFPVFFLLQTNPTKVGWPNLRTCRPEAHPVPKPDHLTISHGTSPRQ